MISDFYLYQIIYNSVISLIEGVEFATIEKLDIQTDEGFGHLLGFLVLEVSSLGNIFNQFNLLVGENNVFLALEIAMVFIRELGLLYANYPSFMVVYNIFNKEG